MYIHNPVADFISEMVASRQKYRCQVDGRDEFQGEKLPVGTKEEVLSWIKDRFKLVDEFWFEDGVEFSEAEAQPIFSILSIFVVIHWRSRASHGCRSLLSFATALM